MNLPLERLHPARLGDALARIEHLARSHMTEIGVGYLQITEIEQKPVILPSLEDPSTVSYLSYSFQALQELCRMLAPSLGSLAYPTSLEIFQDGVLLHFGQICYGSYPRPAILVATDLERSLRLLELATRRRSSTTFHLTVDGIDVTMPAFDHADALLRAHLLHGQEDYLSPDTGMLITRDTLTPSPVGLLAIARRRLNMAKAALR